MLKPMVEQDPSRYRLKQLILYIADKLRGADSFGESKLNKILYRSELAAFRELGKTLTAYRYIKNRYGPTLRAYMHITREMEDEGLISWQVRRQRALNERRPEPLRSWDPTVFSPDELVLVDQEIERARPLTAKEISDEEHQTAAWYATQMGEVIKPELAFVEDPGVMIPLTDEEEEWARSAIEEYLAGAGTSQNARP